ncbi:unnamed protein product [Rotaria socialis]|uniref:Uncharacterized protein n=2 Tax=Rotaria socialis TaxID=392032 RepID=A0A818FW53_9BILA|nr:unnamed protein product [Rotaria socialis]
MKLDSSTNFHPNAYKISLETCLQKIVDEVLFLCEDIEVLRGEKQDITANFYKNISNEESVSILRIRDHSRTYQNIENYFHEHLSNVEQFLRFLKSEPWKIIHDTLMTKIEIFKDPTLGKRWLTITFDLFEQQLESSITKSSNPMSITTAIHVPCDIERLERDYDLLRNEKLMKYFTQVQRGLQSLFLSAVIADADIFAIRSPDLSKNFQNIDDLVPEAKTILQTISNIFTSISQKRIQNKLDELYNLCVRFPCIPELLARKITVRKRDFIMNLTDNDKIGLCSKLDTIIIANNRTQHLSVQQRLALRDTKKLDACSIQLIRQDEINPLKESRVDDIGNKISPAF